MNTSVPIEFAKTGSPRLGNPSDRIDYYRALTVNVIQLGVFHTSLALYF